MEDFMAITQCSEDEARAALAGAGGNLELAMNTFFSGGAVPVPVPAPAPASDDDDVDAAWLAQFESITGVALEGDDARGFFALSGGNLELAMNTFFENGGSLPPPERTAVEPSAVATLGDVMFPPAAAAGAPLGGEGWTGQGFEFWLPGGPDENGGDDFSRTGFVQHRNGPCGVLAAVQAVLWAQCRVKENWSPAFAPSDDDLAAAIASIIAMAAEGEGGGGGCVVATVCDVRAAEEEGGSAPRIPRGEALVAHVRETIESFKAPGGCLLLVYSAVLTKGIGNIMREIRSCGGEPPLIVGSNSLCSSELLTLLLRGSADGNFGAYSAIAGSRVDWPESVQPVGLLSFAEIEGQTPIPVCDRLKTPRCPVWILHGGDHFTCAFLPTDDQDGVPLEPREDEDEGEGEDEGEEGESKTQSPAPFTLYHWNGLPPGGPRMERVVVTAKTAAKRAPESHRDGVGVYYKPVVGSIDSVVQADPADKAARPKQWKTWRYEVVLAVEEEGVDGEERPADLSLPPTFTLPPAAEAAPGPWRCAKCFASRYRTMCFGQNDDGGATACQHCGTERQEAGWSLWMQYSELPRSWQSRMTRQHAPKIISLLRTKWPSAAVEFGDPLNPPSV